MDNCRCNLWITAGYVPKWPVCPHIESYPHGIVNKFLGFLPS